MKRKHTIPRGFKFADTLRLDDIEWDEEAEAREAREAKKALRVEAHKLRSRMQQLFSPKRQRSLAKDRLWLRRYAELEQWQRRCEKEEQATEKFLQSLRASMHNQMERVWLAEQLKRAEKVGREIARDICRAERKELLRRGVVRGIRK